MRDKLVIENIKEEIFNKKKDQIRSNFSIEKKIKKEKISENKEQIDENKLQKSMNLDFENQNLGLFSEFHGNFN